ncbi:MAG: DUF4115 domain-containing protein, partial [Paracoccus sp. (in: a-proteobacteria)]|nr:DUF4115 domain-containing protein [Paracoccus sp. (in: a-proteobacteria)]
DPDWTFRRFCAESGFQPTHGMAPSAAGPKPTRRPSDPAEALANPRALFIPQERSFWSDLEPRAIGALAVLIVISGALAYGGYAVLQEVQRVTLTPGDDIPQLITELDPTQGAGLSGPEIENRDPAQIAQRLPQPEAMDRLYRPQVLEAPVLTARDGPIAAINPGLREGVAAVEAVIADIARIDAVQPPVALDGAQPFGPVLTADLLDGGQDQAAADAEPSVRTLAPDAPQLELLAARPAWVRVTSADGTVLLEKIMDAGERFALPKLEEPPRLRTGNSGAVYFMVDGQTRGPVAPGAQVVSNVELSPASLTDRFALADPGADPELAQFISVAQAGPSPDED